MMKEPVTDDLRAVATDLGEWWDENVIPEIERVIIERARIAAETRHLPLARPVDEPHLCPCDCHKAHLCTCWQVRKLHPPSIVPSASSPTNVRVELPHRAMSCGHCRCNLVDVQTGDLCGACERLERIAEIIERNGYVCRDGSPSTFGRQYQSVLQIYKLATEELGRSHKGEV